MSGVSIQQNAQDKALVKSYAKVCEGRSSQVLSDCVSGIRSARFCKRLQRTFDCCSCFLGLDHLGNARSVTCKICRPKDDGPKGARRLRKIVSCGPTMRCASTATFAIKSTPEKTKVGDPQDIGDMTEWLTKLM